MRKPWNLVNLRFRYMLETAAANLGERRNLLVPIAVKVLLRIVYRHAAVDAIRQRRVLHNRHALVRAVCVLEEHGCSPVVANLVSSFHRYKAAHRYLKSSEKVHVVQSACTAGSASMVALKALPPTIWCTCAEGSFPGSTSGSSRWMLTVEHPKRSAACAGATRAAIRYNNLILACILGEETAASSSM